MSVAGGELILQLVLVLCFGSDNRPALVVLSPPELLVVATPEGSVLSHEFVFHLFREPRLVVSVDTDCLCGDARFHTEAYVGCHSVCVFVEIGTCVLKDTPVRTLEAAAQCLCTLGTPLFQGLFHRLDSFELLSVSGDQDDGVVVRFSLVEHGHWHDMLLCIPCNSGQVFCLYVLNSPRAVCILVALY